MTQLGHRQPGHPERLWKMLDCPCFPKNRPGRNNANNYKLFRRGDVLRVVCRRCGAEHAFRIIEDMSI